MPPLHFSLDFSRRIGYKKNYEMPVSCMRSARNIKSRRRAGAPTAVASRQRQILDRLAAEYARHLHDLLQHRELMKGSVYQIQTRCGNPTCHCAKPQGARHSATVLSWSEDGKTRIRSLPAADRARIRPLTGNYRRLRQSRAALAKLHRQVLQAIDRLEEALRLPPPASPGQRKGRT